MEDESLVVKTDYEAADDLTTLLIELFNGHETLRKSPLYIFAESYGGKFAVTLAIAALQAIEAGNLKVQLAGTVSIQSPFKQNICYWIFPGLVA